MRVALSKVWELMAMPSCIFQSWGGGTGMTFLLWSLGNGTALITPSSAKGQDTCGNFFFFKEWYLGFLCIFGFLLCLWSSIASLVFSAVLVSLVWQWPDCLSSLSIWTFCITPVWLRIQARYSKNYLKPYVLCFYHIIMYSGGWWLLANRRALLFADHPLTYE